MFDLDKLTRKNIKALQPYSSAREEFKGRADVYLDANENSTGSVLNGYNRYPDPLQKKLKEKIGAIKGIGADRIFLGNGSDECIDLLFRCFGEPGTDNAIICPPTYGMYEVSANINAIGVRKVPLTTGFDLDEAAILSAVDEHTKFIWICSPNNPTGNTMNTAVVERLLQTFDGLVIVDEAYIDFSGKQGWLPALGKYGNLVVLQTSSKAWGLAGLRLGMAFASPAIVGILNKVKPPYNVNDATQELVLRALANMEDAAARIDTIISERGSLEKKLSQLDIVEHIYPSAANFLLVKVKQASTLYKKLLGAGIVVRDRSREQNCENCLRITVGTKQENEKLIQTIQQYQGEFL